MEQQEKQTNGAFCAGNKIPLDARCILQDEDLFDNATLGAYVRALAYQWIYGSLPSDPERLSGICRTSPAAMEATWRNIAHRFTAHSTSPSRIMDEQSAQQRLAALRRRDGNSKGGKQRALNYTSTGID